MHSLFLRLTQHSGVGDASTEIWTSKPRQDRDVSANRRSQRVACGTPAPGAGSPGAALGGVTAATQQRFCDASAERSRAGAPRWF